MKSSINIFWFKRDLRLSDNEALTSAVAAGKPLLLLFFFEPSIQKSPTWNARHWWFQHRSVLNLQQQLEPHGIQLYAFHNEVLPVLKTLAVHYRIETLFSHEETGIGITFERDKLVRKFCEANGISWQETPSGAVICGLKNRNRWKLHWNATMKKPLAKLEVEKIIPFTLPTSVVDEIVGAPLPTEVLHGDGIFRPDPQFQEVGEAAAHRLLDDFLTERSVNYLAHLWKATESRYSLSRLSAHLAWGNISEKQVYQTVQNYIRYTALPLGHRRSIQAFVGKLQLRSHFIQKFESECEMEFQNQNRAYNGIRVRHDAAHFAAWQTGNTGYPLVDAAMRCVIETGYINFRLRAMLVSFLTHLLWLDWKRGAAHLAQHFLDFEPGIHYAQFQMQSGCTGTNTVRIYNPMKQGMENDPTGAFVQQWLPALRNVPAPLCHQPWELSVMEQTLYNCRIGVDYPQPIVDYKTAYARASRELHRVKQSAIGQEEAKRILEKHSIAR